MNERFKLLRKSLNITQSEIGLKIGVTKSNISRIEKGTTNITDRIINDICREYEVNEEWLRTGNSKMFKEYKYLNQRIKLLRETLNLNQENFASKINVTRSAVSNYEKGFRNVMDRVIYDICREFNVNEEWLRDGVGEMFNQNDFSLDKYAKSREATNFDIELIKIYLDMPADLKTRLKDLLSTIN